MYTYHLRTIRPRGFDYWINNVLSRRLLLKIKTSCRQRKNQLWY